MAKRPPTIPDSELDVLKVLWDRGQATVREVLETLRAAGRQWSYATVATLLDRLETKGVVTSDRSELAFVYKPTISTHEVRQKRLNNLVDKLYQGEPGLLVLHLLKSHPLDPQQAQEVRSLLEEMTGERPPETRPSGPPDAENPPTPAEVDSMLAELAPTSKVTQGTPVRYAGREAYVMTLRPKDEGTTLVDHGRVLIDSGTFLPLELALYAQGSPDPVFSWREEPRKPEMRTEPKKVETVAEAQKLVNFEIGELASPPGGRELRGVYLKGSDCVVLTYGSGWGTVVLAQGPQRDGASVSRSETAGGDTTLPKVDLGGGEATELSTPVGTGLRWNAGGVSYALAGSVPAPELERAARELR